MYVKTIYVMSVCLLLKPYKLDAIECNPRVRCITALRIDINNAVAKKLTRRMLQDLPFSPPVNDISGKAESGGLEGSSLRFLSRITSAVS